MKKLNVQKFVGMSMLTAIIVVLQYFVGNSIKIASNVSVSLVLLPIVVGAAVYGPSAGAILGSVFGVVVIAGYLFGMIPPDFMWVGNPFLTSLVCIVKGGAAGFVSGFIFKLFANEGTFNARFLGSYMAAIVCPIVNTGIFFIALFTILKTYLLNFLADEKMGVMVYVGLIGLNFVAELAVNIILAPVIVRVVDALKVRKKG